MYERYYVVDKTLETVGDAWFDYTTKQYIVYIPSLAVYTEFADFDLMEHYLWDLGLDAV